ncbi:CorA family divalent cation transporter [Enterovibrio coralii]|uniref:Magnesium transporter n=1 Tax=Enterovibrio coralii TaxID=294935 RepID=A0A135I5V3_9GAMM|nr:CorA family divalent cation transporter [Enterovibrio coralii]KXF80828.1 magnesium transporter [Enterovibrio coralii]
MSEFIVTSWDFSSGTAKQMDPKPVRIEKGHWFHCQRDGDGGQAWLAQNHIPEAIIDSLLADDTRPRFEQFSDDCFLIILRSINMNEGSDPDDMMSLRILWFNGAIISTRKVPSKAVSTLLEKLQNGIGPKDLPSLLLGMFNGVNQIISDFLDPVEDTIDDLDDNATITAQELNQLYSRLLRLRRYLKPQGYAFDDLINARLPVLKQQKNHVKNCLDTISRINESIEFYIDQINLYQASVNQKQSEVMNRNTYLFSVVAGIFLPAGFFTGLLGVNIGGMPGINNPLAFTVFCIALLVVVALEVLLLKRMRFI